MSPFTPEQASRLLTSFTNFLTIATHSILYHRALYPAASFLTARAYNLPVHQSRHPGLCTWIRDAVASAADQIRAGAAHALFIVIYSPTSAVLERWVFDLSSFPASFGDKAKVSRDFKTGDTGGDVNWADVDEALRGALRRIAFRAEGKGKLPEGCTFTIAVELRDEAEPPISHPQVWIPSEPSLQVPSHRYPHHGTARGGELTTPIRAVQAGPLFFECWVEEREEEAASSSQAEENEMDVTIGSDITTLSQQII
ncbi:hypothetical protein VHEMI07943 [[Torrubiella] hemipterigena]|uniref:HORMA domain-containing protein n=1 Tax=[Torrubiella] hemipterigena TaxID=1531966 RepID=A0A0A1TNU6_9HYPO|nr:hypothetical protein VHEMI07943 [[Torrubiella] hemipterigena]